MINDGMDKVLLVKGWSNKSGWTFPKGKINKDEPEIECAIREVGLFFVYDVLCVIGINHVFF